LTRPDPIHGARQDRLDHARLGAFSLRPPLPSRQLLWKQLP
jgi:hypothetical protein